MIDIEKFICSLLADHPEGVVVRGDIHRALKEQGLEYKDEKIVPIEDKTELKDSDDNEIRESIIGFLITISSLKDGMTLSNEDFDSKTILEWVEWLEKQSEKPIERKEFTSIPFGAYDSEFIKEAIAIPDGCVATIEGNKIHIKKK